MKLGKTIIAPGWTLYAGQYLVLVFLLVPMHLRLRNYAYDDAFIHLRIARNLLTGGKAYFNPGEAVMASSSPGWTLLLAALGRFLPLGAGLLAVLNAGITALLACLWAAAARRLGGLRRWEAVFASVLVALPLVLPSSLGLMESPLALVLLFAGVVTAEPWPLRSQALLALAACVRPEMVLAWGLAGCWQVLRRKRPFWPLACVSAVAAGPFVAFDLWQFGTVVPNTIRAKSIVYELSRRSVALNLLSIKGGRWRWLGVLSDGALVCASIAACPMAPRVKTKAGGNLLWIFGLLLAGAYIAAKAFVFGWYLPLVELPFASGALFVAWPSVRLRAPVLVALAVFMAPFWGSSAGTAVAGLDRGRLSDDPDAAGSARTRSYRLIGAELNAACPAATLLAPEIGGLGWTFRGRLVDACGLASPEALRFHPMKVPRDRSNGAIGAIPPGFVEEIRPDIIVTAPIFAEALLREPWITAYRRLAVPVYLPIDAARLGSDELWGSKEILVLIRKNGRCDVPASAFAHAHELWPTGGAGSNAMPPP